MSFEINDVTSQILQHHLQAASKDLETSLVRISYGEQTKAAENAANLMISEGMESQRRGSMQAIQNAQMGSNMLSIAESGLSSISDNMQRIRELEIQRRNDTLGEEEKAAIESEMDALTEEIDRVAASTSYNDIKLLDGSSDDITLQTGPNAEEETNTLNVGEALGSVSSGSLELNRDDPDFLDKIDNALDTINSKRSQIGAMSNRIESSINSLYIQNENLTASQSRIIDVDVAAEASKMTQSQILQQASVSLLAQANQSPSLAAMLL